MATGSGFDFSGLSKPGQEQESADGKVDFGGLNDKPTVKKKDVKVEPTGKESQTGLPKTQPGSGLKISQGKISLGTQRSTQPEQPKTVTVQEKEKIQKAVQAAPAPIETAPAKELTPEEIRTKIKQGQYESAAIQAGGTGEAFLVNEYTGFEDAHSRDKEARERVKSIEYEHDKKYQDWRARNQFGEYGITSPKRKEAEANMIWLTAAEKNELALARSEQRAAQADIKRYKAEMSNQFESDINNSFISNASGTMYADGRKMYLKDSESVSYSEDDRKTYNGAMNGFTKEGEYGIIVDVDKVSQEAERQAQRRQLPKNGYFYEEYKRNLTGAVESQILKQKIDDEFSTLYRQEKGESLPETMKRVSKENQDKFKTELDNYSSYKTLETQYSETAKATQLEVKTKTDAELKTLEDQYTSQYEALMEEVKNDKQIEMAQLQFADSEIKRLTKLVQSNQMTVEQANEYLKSEDYRSKMSAAVQPIIDQNYSQRATQIFDEYLKNANGVRKRAQEGYSRRMAALKAQYQPAMERAIDNFEKEFKGSDIDRNLIKNLYDKAYKNVLTSEKNRHMSIAMDNSWFKDFTVEFLGATGGVFKNLGQALGDQSMRNWGEDVEKYYFNYNPKELKSVSDIFNSNASSAYFGSMLGRMVPGMTAGAVVTAATGGMGAPAAAAMIMGGLTNWWFESTDMAVSMYNDVLEQTGDFARADKARDEVFNEQIKIMHLYAADMVPIFGKMPFKSAFARGLANVGVETATELSQEYVQGSSEEDILDAATNLDVPIDEIKARALHWDGEKFKNTALNTIPLTLVVGGGPSAISGTWDMSKSAYFKSKARSYQAKVDMSAVTSANADQALYRVFMETGSNTASAMNEILFANGTIDQATRDKNNIAIEGFKKLKDIHSKIGMVQKDGPLQMASMVMFGKYTQARDAYNAETDPSVKEILNKKMKDAEKAWLGLFENKDPDLVVMILPSGEYFMYDPVQAEQMLEDEKIQKQVLDGTIKIDVTGSAENKSYANVLGKIETLMNAVPEPTWREKTSEEKAAEAAANPEKERKDAIKADIEVADAVPTVEEALRSGGTFEINGEVGSIYQEGDMVLIETPTRKVELGNISEVSEKNVSELGLKPQKALEVLINDDNSVTVEGVRYVNNYSDPMAAVSVDKDGNYSVSLETEKGQKRTFRKGRAEAIVYQIKLKQLENATEQQIAEVTRLAEQALASQSKVEPITVEPAAEGAGITGQEQTANQPEPITLKPTTDAVQVETAGQVPVQPEARPGQEVAEGKPQAEPQEVAQEGVQEEVAPAKKWSPSDTIKKLRERQKKFSAETVDQAVDSINSALKSSGIKATIIESEQEWERETKGQARGTSGIFITNDGSGRILINRQRLQEGWGTTVVWHEGTHPVMNIIRNTNPKLYARMVKGLEKARMSAPEDVKAEMQLVVDFVNKEYAKDPELTREDETIVETIARIGDGLIDIDQLPRSFKQVLIDFINEMAQFFGLDPILADTDITTFQRTSKAISEALKSGKDISSIVGKENVTRFEFEGGKQEARISSETALAKEKSAKRDIIDVAKEFERSVDEVLSPTSSTDRRTRRFLINAYEDLRYFLAEFKGDVGLDWYTNKMREFDAKLMEASDIAIERGEMPAENSLRIPENMELFKAVLALSSTGENPKRNTDAAFNIWKSFNVGEMVFEKYQPGKVSLRTRIEMRRADGSLKIDKKTGLVQYRADSGPIIKETKTTITVATEFDKNGNVKKSFTVKKSDLTPAVSIQYKTVDNKGKEVIKSVDEIRVWKETEKYYYLGKPTYKEGLTKVAKSDVISIEQIDNGVAGKGWTARGGTVATNLERLEKLMQEKGGIAGAVKWLKDKHPIKELWEYNLNVPDINGGKSQNPVGERYGSFIFGEKLGPFHQNVSGVPTELTMDLWWSRTWNRYMGTLITGKGKDVDIQEVPRTDAERNIMREAARIAAEELGLEVHELQAALWYMEQQMYKNMGAAVESYSFVDGINDILKKYGKTEEQLRSENYGVDSTESDKKRQDAAARAADILFGKGGEIRGREDEGVAGQRSSAGLRFSEKVNAIKKIPFDQDGGATLNLDGTDYSGGGVVVPIDTINLTQDTFNEQALLDFISKNFDKIGNDKVRPGIYKFPNSKKVSIDLNIVIPREHMDLALQFGKFAGQESLWNLDKGAYEYTGSDGKNPSEFTADEFKEIANALTEGRIPNISGMPGYNERRQESKAGVRTSAKDKVKGTYMEPFMTSDGKDYLFFHTSYADAKSIMKGIDSSKYYSTHTSKQEKSTQYGLASYYTQPRDGERMVGGDKYVVRVPKEKVYPMDIDPNGYGVAAAKKYPENYPFRDSWINKYIADKAKKDGFIMMVGEWGLDRSGKKKNTGIPNLRADAVVVLKPTNEDYSDFESNVEKGMPLVEHPAAAYEKLMDSLTKLGKSLYDYFSSVTSKDVDAKSNMAYDLSMTGQIEDTKTGEFRPITMSEFEFMTEELPARFDNRVSKVRAEMKQVPQIQKSTAGDRVSTTDRSESFFNEMDKVFPNDHILGGYAATDSQGNLLGRILMDYVDENTIKITEVVSQKRGERVGNGTKIMNIVTSVADKNGVAITLTPNLIGDMRAKGFETAEKLRSFYSNFGFIKDPGKGTMTRTPNLTGAQFSTAGERMSAADVAKRLEGYSTYSENKKAKTAISIDIINKKFANQRGDSNAKMFPSVSNPLIRIFDKKDVPEVAFEEAQPNKCETNVFKFCKKNPSRYYPVGGYFITKTDFPVEHWWVYDSFNNSYFDVTPNESKDVPDDYVKGYVGVVNKSIGEEIQKANSVWDVEFFKGGNVQSLYLTPLTDINTPKAIASAYVQAKADGSNPELVKAVEAAIGEPTIQPSKGQRSTSAERFGTPEEMFETHKIYVELAAEALDAGVQTYQEFIEGLDEPKTTLSENAWREARRIAQGKSPRINGPEDMVSGPKKALATRAYEGGSQEELKDAIADLGLTYEVVTNEGAMEAARQFVDRVGIDNAVMAVRNGLMDGSQAAFVYSIIIDMLGAMQVSATTESERMALMARQVAMIGEFDARARDKGRFIQALSYVYAKSDFPYSIQFIKDKLKEANNGVDVSAEVRVAVENMVSQITEISNKIREQEQKIAQLEEQVAIDNIVSAAMSEDKGKNKKSTSQKIADKIREGKLNRPGMFMSASPASIAWDAALETAATIIENGGKLADAIAAGVRSIRSSDWWKNSDDKTRAEGEKVFAQHLADSQDGAKKGKAEKPSLDQDGKIQIPFSLLKQLVKDGVTTIEEMTSIITDMLSSQYEGITERMVRDAITKYGKQKLPTKDETLRAIAEMKRDGQLLSALEDVESGKLPKKSGFQRDKPTDKQREMMRKIKDRMKELPQEQADIERSWASSQERIRTMLTNRIADLNAQIAAGRRESRTNKSVELDEKNKQLKAEVERLNQELDNLVGKPQISHETKVKNAVRAIEKTISEIEEMILKGDIGYRASGQKIEDPRIEMARERLKGLRDLLAQAREEQGVAEAYRISKYKERLKKDIAQMQQDLADGNFAKKESRDLSMADEEIKKLRAEKMKLKEKIDLEIERIRMKNRSNPEKAWDTAVNIFNIPRTMLASADLSAPLRQGLILSLRNPRIAAAAIRDMLRFAVSKVSEEQYMDALKSSPEYMVMKEAGLFLSLPSTELSAREEDFMSNIPERIPFYGKIIAGTQRAYTGYLNKLRADVFMSFHNQLIKEGYTGVELMENLKSFAGFVNAASGRGRLPKSLEPAGAALSGLFFAPRYVASRFEVLGRLATLGAGMPKAARKEMLKTMGTYIGLGMMTMYMMAAAGAEVEDDPRSSDFGKIKLGDLRFDIWAGSQQIVVLFSRILTGATKKTGTGEIVPFFSGGWNEANIWTTIEDFLGNKLSPNAAIFADFMKGEFKYDKKLFGMELAKTGEPFTWTSALLGSLAPIWINDIGEIYKEQGLFDATIAGTASFFGIGVQFYGPSIKDKIQNDIYQYFNENKADFESDEFNQRFTEYAKDTLLPKYEADEDYSKDVRNEAYNTAKVLYLTNDRPSWYRDAYYASTGDRRLAIILANTQGLSKSELEKVILDMGKRGVISEEFYYEKIEPLMAK